MRTSLGSLYGRFAAPWLFFGGLLGGPGGRLGSLMFTFGVCGVLGLVRDGLQQPLGEPLDGPRASLIVKNQWKHDVPTKHEKMTTRHVATLVGGGSWVHSGLDL